MQTEAQVLNQGEELAPLDDFDGAGIVHVEIVLAGQSGAHIRDNPVPEAVVGGQEDDVVEIAGIGEGGEGGVGHEHRHVIGSGIV